MAKATFVLMGPEMGLVKVPKTNVVNCTECELRLKKYFGQTHKKYTPRKSLKSNHELLNTNRWELGSFSRWTEKKVVALQ